jgi:hypothetical protein
VSGRGPSGFIEEHHALLERIAAALERLAEPPQLEAVEDPELSRRVEVLERLEKLAPADGAAGQVARDLLEVLAQFSASGVWLPSSAAVEWLRSTEPERGRHRRRALVELLGVPAATADRILEQLGLV